MQDHDTKPWYRQFWPWFLICLPASAVVASLYTVSLAYRTSDSLVVSSDDGMDVVAQRQLGAERHARELGLSAQLRFDMNSGAIAVTLAADMAIDWPKTLQLELSHPAFAERDQRITVTAALPDSDGNPNWSGHFITVPTGRWYVVLHDGDSWRLSGSWSGAADLRLLPAGTPGDEQR